jgi:hypothetical protein
MPRFVAVHTMPMTEEQWKERMMTGEKPAFPPGVVWKLTYCDFADGKFFCEWEAPNKETIEQIFKAQNMPFDAIYPVRLFDFAKMTLEP